jgi:hypothetical protein
MTRKSRLRLSEDELALLHQYRRERYERPENHALGETLVDAIEDARGCAEPSEGDT